ncbi:hypothetical protein BDA96_01G382500 [Sorghum bicolor]|uniref:Uncharacterized protein n=2 Tax=Sorghum bicolor TaxID=4558 RepID=A0A921S5P2_SORBI|nr:hypothetical protein BDA96_01G382500 [Sorghum bicolor]OQU92531.1 hypothetical protein SORBI_3001G358432 [Sorghum bicolor]
MEKTRVPRACARPSGNRQTSRKKQPDKGAQQRVPGATSSLVSLVEEQVLRHAARAVGTHDRRTQRERGEDERAHRREEHDERGRGDKAIQHLAVGEGAAERGDGRRVGRAEHVEEAPRRQQHGQRERVRQEGRGHAQRGDRGVVDAEVGAGSSGGGRWPRPGCLGGRARSSPPARTTGRRNRAVAAARVKTGQSDSKGGNKDIVLPGTHLSDTVNGRK